MVAHFAPVNVHLRGGGKKIHWMKVFVSAPSVARRKQRMWQRGGRCAVGRLLFSPSCSYSSDYWRCKRCFVAVVVVVVDIGGGGGGGAIPWKRRKPAVLFTVATFEKKRKKGCRREHVSNERGEKSVSSLLWNRIGEEKSRTSFPFLSNCNTFLFIFSQIEKFKDSTLSIRIYFCRLFRWNHDSQSNDRITLTIGFANLLDRQDRTFMGSINPV